MRLPREAAQTERGWDSYDGAPTTESAVKTAEAFTHWSPMNDGGLGIEAYCGGAEVMIEVGPDGKIRQVGWSKPGS